MTANKPEMEPCPLCRKNDCCVRDKGMAGEEDWCRLYAVWCNDCGCSSGWYQTEAEAIAAWNTRPAQAGNATADTETLTYMREIAQGMGYPSVLEALEHLSDLRQPVDAIDAEGVEQGRRAEFDDGAGVEYTISKLRTELDDLYRREPPKDAPKVRPGRLSDVGPSIIGRLQQIDHLQRFQIAGLERRLSDALNPPRHRFWGAGEPDCPPEIKAGNGELHTLRCKVCGQDNPRDDRCIALAALASTDDGEEG